MRLAAALMTATAVGVALLFWGLRSPTELCDELDDLFDHSNNFFASARVELVDEPGGEWSTSFMIDGSSACSITVDPARASHLCEWVFESNSSPEVHFDDLVASVRQCPSALDERQDASVNHPDFWASTYFTMHDHQVSVSLKDKTTLGKTFVTLQVDTPPLPPS